MPLELFHDTIAAIATAEGRGALGIIRISGADAIRIVSKIVRDPDAVLAARGGTSIYSAILCRDAPPARLRPATTGTPGRGGPPNGERDAPVARLYGAVDDVVIHIYRAPRSYTGEDLLEITAHGSAVIAEEILSLLIANGARQAEPGEFSRRAFFNSKIGIEEAELISIKAQAQSEKELRGAELANHEKFGRLREAYDALITLIARVDAEIDFGDSDQIEIADFPERIAEVSSLVEGLVRDSANRRENAGYFTVALTGPPNVGKSSIFNALLNFERSIVSEVPGTTRDYVEAFINVDGFRVKLVDTAGIREASETLEARGIALGMGAARHADISLRITEPSERLPVGTNGDILLHNKIDLDNWNENLRVSALTGEGISDLHRWLSSALRERSSELSHIRLSESETLELRCVMDALRGVSLALEPPLLAEELRQASAHLAQLLGMNVSTDSLDYIFTKMCIGK